MAADFNHWCRLCSAVEAELVTDVDQLLFIENTFSVPILEIMICPQCIKKITDILELIETSHHINQMYLDLQTIESQDLSSEMLKEVRSNYGLESSESESEFDDSGMSICSINGSILEMIDGIEMGDSQIEIESRADDGKVLRVKDKVGEDESKNFKVLKGESNVKVKKNDRNFNISKLEKKHKISPKSDHHKINPNAFKNSTQQSSQDPPQLAQFVCKFCGRSFNYKSVLNYHESTHESALDKRQKFTCDIDGSKFTTKGKLQIHMDVRHLRKNQFACACGRIFFTKARLKEHFKDSHGSCTFSCDSCDFSTSSSKKLNIHNKTKHGNQSFACEICRVSFKCEKYLKSHKITHQSEKLHRCEAENCGKMFKRLRELKTHRSQHSGGTPHTCEFCPKAFADSANRNKHAHKVHPSSVAHMLATLGPKWRVKLKHLSK